MDLQRLTVELEYAMSEVARQRADSDKVMKENEFLKKLLQEKENMLLEIQEQTPRKDESLRKTLEDEIRMRFDLIC
jgi:hypothetical protein